MADKKVPRKIALALQGGGSHGAFTWGVLDRLLEDETLEIIGITGTSAGAMNAVVMADGLVRGGREEARLRLRRFWEEIGRMPGFAGLLGLFRGEFQAQMHLEQTPTYQALDALTRNLSPYDLNPFNFNPLRDTLIKLVDFDRLRAQEDLAPPRRGLRSAASPRGRRARTATAASPEPNSSRTAGFRRTRASAGARRQPFGDGALQRLGRSLHASFESIVQADIPVGAGDHHAANAVQAVR